MPRRSRPAHTKGSEHWLRVMVNDRTSEINRRISDSFGWCNVQIDWRSPRRDDDYAEYFDQDFLDRLRVIDMVMSLKNFRPRSGPRWDGLALTRDSKLILVEAKAHIGEVVDFSSKASLDARKRIENRLDEAKEAFRAYSGSCWHTPFYQMANRLAHLNFLAGINKKDAYLVFIYFRLTIFRSS